MTVNLLLSGTIIIIKLSETQACIMSTEFHTTTSQYFKLWMDKIQIKTLISSSSLKKAELIKILTTSQVNYCSLHNAKMEKLFWCYHTNGFNFQIMNWFWFHIRKSGGHLTWLTCNCTEHFYKMDTFLNCRAWVDPCPLQSFLIFLHIAEQSHR